MKKYLAEMVGTAVLVLIGCGVAVSLNCTSDCSAAYNAASVIGTAMAFGCHINPAITLGCYCSGRIGGKDALMYVIFQCIGAFIGSAILFALTNGVDGLSGTGANDLQSGVGVVSACVAEFVFTMIFVLVVLGTTDAKKGAGNFAGLAIGLSLILIHLVCIRYTGTSVNPARSLAPAIFQGGTALQNLWIFIVCPLLGGACAAGVWKAISCDCDKCEK